jgi:hypothetical protein
MAACGARASPLDLPTFDLVAAGPAQPQRIPVIVEPPHVDQPLDLAVLGGRKRVHAVRHEAHAVLFVHCIEVFKPFVTDLDWRLHFGICFLARQPGVVRADNLTRVALFQQMSAAVLNGFVVVP